MSLLLPSAFVLCVAWLALRWYRWTTRLNVAYIRGPPVKSWLLGNLRDMAFQENVGDLDFEYIEEYGAVWRMQQPLGSQVLMVADPKALHHIFHKTGYLYPKTHQAIMNAYIVAGKNVVWAPTGDIHARHRKVMNPAFSSAQLRAYLPCFRRASGKVCQLWRDQIFSQAPAGATIGVDRWMARAALDIIGETAFDFDFGALDDASNELSAAYHNMFADSTLRPSAAQAVFQSTWTHVPLRVLERVRHLPLRDIARFQRTVRVFNTYAHRLMARGAAGETHGRDVMSVLAHANASADPRTRLSAEEVRAQMCALTFAGHETTANTATWLLWELARHPAHQDAVRAEVAARRAHVAARGGVDFAVEDLNALPCLEAAIMETLRCHCIVFHLNRVASQDDVIPLSRPITTRTGEKITEIPVAAGQVVMPNIAVYNRLPEVWGADAHLWDPTRFLDGRVDNPEVRLGMYGNILTFSGGVRGCIGWRFAMLEMLAIVADLVEHFRFSIPEDKPEIVRAPSMLMAPMIKGKVHEGSQMPLHVEMI